MNLEGEGFVKVIAGAGIADQRGPVVRDDIELIFLDVYLPPHSRLTQPVPKGHTAFAYVADGTAEFGCGSLNSPATLEDRMIAVFDEGDHISAVTDGAHTRFLLVAGRPIAEPIVRQGPFVMNTKAEIETALNDYRSGALG